MLQTTRKQTNVYYGETIKQSSIVTFYLRFTAKLLNICCEVASLLWGIKIDT